MTQVSSDINNRLIVTKSSGTFVNGTSANADFTSDPICLNDKPWSIVWNFNGLSVTGLPPIVTIEATNDPDFGPDNWEQIPRGRFVLPNMARSRTFEALAIRLVYEYRGATAGTHSVFINQKES